MGVLWEFVDRRALHADEVWAMNTLNQNLSLKSPLIIIVLAGCVSQNGKKHSRAACSYGTVVGRGEEEQQGSG